MLGNMRCRHIFLAKGVFIMRVAFKPRWRQSILRTQRDLGEVLLRGFVSIFRPFFDHTIRKWQSAKTSQQYFVIVQNGAKMHKYFFFQWVAIFFNKYTILKIYFFLKNQFWQNLTFRPTWIFAPKLEDFPEYFIYTVFEF